LPYLPRQITAAHRLFAFIIFTVGFAGCNTLVGDKPDEGQLVYPAPPADARFRQVFELRNSNDILRKTTAERLQQIATGFGNQGITFDKPYAIASRNGRIYVSDTAMRLIHVYDIARRRYFQMGVRREGTVVKPLGLDVDGEGRIYAADASAGRVIVYDPLGLYIGDLNTDKVKFDRPVGVAASRSGDRIYVVDNDGVTSSQHRVLVFDGDRNYVKSIGSRGVEEGQFNMPRDVAVAGDGTVFVLDAGNFRIQAFDREGKFLRSWGGIGNRPGQFARPRAIAADDNGLVYVSDASYGNVQIFNHEGQLLLFIGKFGTTDVPGNFPMIAGIAADEGGRLYVIDQLFKRVSIFSPVTASKPK